MLVVGFLVFALLALNAVTTFCLMLAQLVLFFIDPFFFCLFLTLYFPELKQCSLVLVKLNLTFTVTCTLPL